MEYSLDQLKTGQKATVKTMNLENEMKNRLRELGLIPGTEVYCRCCNPWGDVMALEFRGTVLALRTWNLRGIQVQPD